MLANTASRAVHITGNAYSHYRARRLLTPGKKSMEKQARDRRRPMKVVVSSEERQEIEQRAKAAGLSVSAYLRNLGIGFEPKSMFDQDAILELVKLHANQGRLGGLLKLWLSEKPGEGTSVKNVRSLLQQIESLQMQLTRIAMRQVLKTK